MLPQSASISMIKPLNPIIKALIAEDLVRHSNMAVKISVACCICEIMRIMAPDSPYDDNQMKTVNPESEKKTLAIIETPMPSNSVTTGNGKRKKQVIPFASEKDSTWSYYKGTVKSFDHFIKKHKVWHDDGDKESIDLKKQKWELVEEVSPYLSIYFGTSYAKLHVTKLNYAICSILLEHGENGSVYSVKQSIAPILEAIFNKHGDILADCSFQVASVRTCFLEVICEVVKRIESSDVSTIISDMEDIQRQVSEAHAANINVSWLRDQLKIIHTRNEALKKTASLKEMKVNTIMLKRPARTDLIKRCEELVAAQERCVTAEVCIKVLDKRADLVTDKPISTIIAKRAARADMMERCRERVVAQEEFEKAERCVTVLNLVENKLSKDILESQCEITHG
ncbi:phospholipase-like protein [Tanacetum coccineum]